MNFLENVQNYIDRYHMLESGDAVVVGVSGGADSVCLLTVLCDLREMYKLTISAVHVNHMIRGEEADRDEASVRNLCQRYDVPLTVIKKDVPSYAHETGMSEEEAGRDIRYKAFQEEAAHLGGAAKIAVAHNRDDLAETVLFNMVRGSSVAGLAGIKPVRDNIIRPLLGTSRMEIESFLAERKITYVTDSTNLETDYSRNRIRQIVLPELKNINTEAVEHIAKIAEDAAAMSDRTEDRAKCVVDYSADENRALIGVEALSSLDDITAGEAVLRAVHAVCGRRKDITRRHVESVLGLTELKSGAGVDLPYGIRVRRNYGEIVFEIPVKCTAEGDRDSEEVHLTGRIETKVYDYKPGMEISKKTYTKMFDYDKIKGVLGLRLPRPEDTIVVNADGGRKKLAKLFTDMKVDRGLRNSVPVVCDDRDVIWVVGYRISEAYKISDKTQRVIEITYIEGER